MSPFPASPAIVSPNTSKKRSPPSSYTRGCSDVGSNTTERSGRGRAPDEISSFTWRLVRRRLLRTTLRVIGEHHRGAAHKNARRDRTALSYRGSLAALWRPPTGKTHGQFTYCPAPSPLPFELDAERSLVRLQCRAEPGVVVEIDPRGVAERERGRSTGIRAIAAFADPLHGDALRAEAHHNRAEGLRKIVDEFA